MKKIVILLVVSLVVSTGFCQKVKVDGSRFIYQSYIYGQLRTLEFEYHFTQNPMIIDWKLRKKQGEYAIEKQALNAGGGMTFKRGENHQTVTLSPNETHFTMISKTALNDLLKKSEFIYNETTYKLIGEEALEVDNMTLNTLHVTAQIDETEMWILKDAEWPIVAKMDKNPFHINFTLSQIIDK